MIYFWIPFYSDTTSKCILIQSRDSELTEAIEEIAANPPATEMQAVVKELEDEKDKLKKENKELKNQIKKFKRAKTGQGAIEVRKIRLLNNTNTNKIHSSSVSFYHCNCSLLLGSLGCRTGKRPGSQRKCRS